MKLVFRESLFSSQSANHTGMFKMGIFMLILLALYLALQVHPALADSTKLPGVDASSQMESAGTLLRFIDTGIFKWGARLLAGLCIFGAAWSLKEGRYGPAVISVRFSSGLLRRGSGTFLQLVDPIVFSPQSRGRFMIPSSADSMRR
jgi:hypothetical protein